MNRQKYISLKSVLGVSLLLTLGFLYPSAVDRLGDLEWPDGDQGCPSDLNECTTGLASGAATPDGRPLLWKNRDVGNVNQEFHYVDDGRIPFISIAYKNDTLYYGGINAAGFAIENSNSYNLGAAAGKNGWGYGEDDGQIHRLALATCRTVDDFQTLMDSLDEGGRTRNSNYGVIDAFGGAAMFETGGHSYTRYDAIDSPDGFLIRSNYSYSGNGLNGRPDGWGPYRHDRAYSRFKAALEAGGITPKYIFQWVSRDISIDGTDPYPLPFDGYVEDEAYGCIPNDEAICRNSTRGVLVAQGVRDGERPEDAVLWAMPGTQLSSIALPLWVRAGSVPTEMDGVTGSRICDRAVSLQSWIYNQGAVDTWKLTNPEGNGLWDYTFQLEDWVFAKTEAFLNSPGFDYDRLEEFQNSLAQQAADSLIAWQPPYPVTELMEPIIEDGNVVLRWDTQPSLNGATPRSYALYRSSDPFREGNLGVKLATLNGTEFVDDDPPAGAAFYRVKGEF